MNAMGHDIPNVLGVDQTDLEGKIRTLLPEYMAMGEKGMHEHAEHAKHMAGPPNTLPMMGGDGPFDIIGMGGMFTVFKVRDDIVTYDDPGWYQHPERTVSERVGGKPASSSHEPVTPDHMQHGHQH